MKFLSRSADSRNSRAGQIAAVGKSASEGVWIHYHVRMGNILFISFIMVCIPFHFILCSIDKICWNTLKKSKVLILKLKFLNENRKPRSQKTSLTNVIKCTTITWRFFTTTWSLPVITWLHSNSESCVLNDTRFFNLIYEYHFEVTTWLIQMIIVMKHESYLMTHW